MDIMHDETDLSVGLSVTCSTSNDIGLGLKDDFSFNGQDLLCAQPCASSEQHFMAPFMSGYGAETVVTSPDIDFNQYTIKNEPVVRTRPNFYRQREELEQGDCTDYRYKLEDNADYRYRKEDSSDYRYRKEDSSDYRYRKEDNSDFRYKMEDNADYRYKNKNYEQKTKHKHKRSSEKSSTKKSQPDNSAQKMQVCKTCGKTFKFQTSLLRHNNKVHFCRYQCGTCCRVFSRQSYLDVHTSKPGTSCYIDHKGKSKKRQRR